MSRTHAAAPGARSRPATLASAAVRRRPRLGAVGWVIIVATLLALALRLYQLSRPGYLLGVTEYDDGTDYGSAVRLVDGMLPYRDFIMVQPPGITVLMAPVALATKGLGTVTGMAVARVVTATASAAAVLLGGLITRHRGLLAVVVTCGVLAVYPDSLAAAHTVLLEPWLVLFCMLGALAVFDRDRLAGRRRLLWGGVAFGVGGAVKVWAILPVAVILALVLAARRPRHALAFVGGVAAGFLVLVLPFALTSPAIFVRGVIIAQLIRTDVVRVAAGFRLQNMLGLTHLSQLPTPLLTLIALAVVAAIAVVVVAGWRSWGQAPPVLDRFALLTCAVVVIAFLWPADFYYHYAAFLAPFLALSIALPSAWLFEAMRRRGREGRAGTLARRSAPAIALVTVAVLAGLQVGAESHLASQVPAGELAAVQRLVPPGDCVLTDQVSYTIAIDRFRSSVPGCSPMVDGVGTDYALSAGHNGQNGAGQVPAVRRLWLSAFRSAQYVWLTGQASRRIPWTPQLRAYFIANFLPLTRGPTWLYVRKGLRPR